MSQEASRVEGQLEEQEHFAGYVWFQGECPSEQWVFQSPPGEALFALLCLEDYGGIESLVGLERASPIVEGICTPEPL